MQKYAGIIKNDVVNGNGVCVSFFVQGCPIHCSGCHNEQDWDFNGGIDLPHNYLDMICEAITANGIQRNFSLLGGEPLCDENLELSLSIVQHVRDKFPDIQIAIWSGYTYESLLERKDDRIAQLFCLADVLVDGPFEIVHRDTTLKMRGSSNQRLIDLHRTTSTNIVLKEYAN